MTIRFQCPSCGAPKEAKDEWAGKTARCKCGATFSIPVPVVEDYADVPMAEPLPEEDTVSFDTFEANDPAPSNNLFADLGDFGAPAQPQPYGNYVPYQMPAPAPSQPVTGKKGAQSQPQSQAHNAPPRPMSKEDKLLAEHMENRSALEYLVQDSRPPMEAWRAGMMVSLVLTGFAMLLMGSLLRSGLINRFAVFVVITGIGVGSFYYDGWKGLAARPIPKGERVSWWLEAILSGGSLMGLFLVVSWGLFASLQQAEEMGEKNAKKIIDEFKPKKNNNNNNSSAALPSFDLSTSDLNKLAVESLKTLSVPGKDQEANPEANVKLVSQEWNEAFDPSPENFADVFSESISVQVNNLATVPGYRYVLINEDLFDLKSKTVKKLKDRRYRFPRAKVGEIEQNVALSSDGQYILAEVWMNEGRSEKFWIVRRFDGLFMDVVPEPRLAYFLPDNRILIYTNQGKWLVHDFFQKQSREIEFPHVGFLGVSPNHKFVLTQRVTNKQAIDEAAVADPPQKVTPILELALWKTSDFSIHAKAAYEGMPVARSHSFSSDGTQLLLSTPTNIYNVSLKDGSLTSRISLKKNETFVGWIGTSNRWIGTQEPNFNGKKYIQVHDSLNGRRLATMSTSETEVEFSSPAYTYLSSFAGNGLGIAPRRKLPLEQIEASAKANNAGNEPLPKLAKMKLKVDDNEIYSEVFSNISTSVLTNQFGFEVIDDSDSRKHCTFTFEYKRKDDFITINMTATTPDGKVFWNKETRGETHTKIRDGKSAFTPAQMVYGITAAFNAVINSREFPVNGDFSTLGVGDSEIIELPTVENVPEGVLAGYPVGELVNANNSWYGPNPTFPTTRLPIMDYKIDSTSGTDAPIKILGDMVTDSSSKLLLIHPELSLSTLAIEKNAQPEKFGDYGDFDFAIYIPGTKELVLAKEQEITFHDTAASAKPRTIKVEDELLGIVASKDGSRLATIHPKRTLIHDLSKFRSKTRKVIPESVEFRTSADPATATLSDNGAWLAGLVRGTDDQAFIFDTALRSSSEFQVATTRKSVGITNDGEFRCELESGQVYIWKEKEDSSNKVPEPQKLEGESALQQKISPSGKQLIRLTKSQILNQISLENGKIISSVWDPGQRAEDYFETSILAWSSDEKYVVWNQGNRLLIWEAESAKPE